MRVVGRAALGQGVTSSGNPPPLAPGGPSHRNLRSSLKHAQPRPDAPMGRSSSAVVFNEQVSASRDGEEVNEPLQRDDEGEQTSGMQPTQEMEPSADVVTAAPVPRKGERCSPHSPRPAPSPSILPPPYHHPNPTAVLCEVPRESTVCQFRVISSRAQIHIAFCCPALCRGVGRRPSLKARRSSRKITDGKKGGSVSSSGSALQGTNWHFMAIFEDSKVCETLCACAHVCEGRLCIAGPSLFSRMQSCPSSITPPLLFVHSTPHRISPLSPVALRKRSVP
jgi:hypothetical protein